MVHDQVFSTNNCYPPPLRLLQSQLSRRTHPEEGASLCTSLAGMLLGKDIATRHGIPHHNGDPIASYTSQPAASPYRGTHRARTDPQPRRISPISCGCHSSTTSFHPAPSPRACAEADQALSTSRKNRTKQVQYVPIGMAPSVMIPTVVHPCAA